jgi:hypothetical protein
MILKAVVRSAIPLWVWLLFSSMPLHAHPQTPVPANHFTWTPLAEQAYQEILSLRFGEARAHLGTLKLQDPKNQLVPWLENYMDFFTLFIGESGKEYQQRKNQLTTRLEKIRQGNEGSPWYRFCQAEVLLQWALARLKFGDYVTAFGEIRQAYGLLEENRKRHPAFIPNLKSLGVLHCLLSAVPDNLQWGTKLLGKGMRGDLKGGQEELQQVLKATGPDARFRQEAVVMYAMVLLYLQQDTREAWSIVNGAQLDPRQNPLACFALASVALRTGRTDQAIQWLESKPSGALYLKFEYLDFQLGIAYLRKLEWQKAEPLLRQYALTFQGKHYIKEAWQKAAWCRLLAGDSKGYKEDILKCLSKGNAQVGNDENALKEAENKKTPDPPLLRCRLLYDGGYLQRAQSELQKLKSYAQSTDTALKLEYFYRTGRVTQGLEKNQEAIAAFQTTVEQGREHPSYYACNAALQLGRIHEKLGDKANAKKWYQACLNIHPKEHKFSLHQQAKAGLEKLR